MQNRDPQHHAGDKAQKNFHTSMRQLYQQRDPTAQQGRGDDQDAISNEDDRRRHVRFLDANAIAWCSDRAAVDARMTDSKLQRTGLDRQTAVPVTTRNELVVE